MPDVQNQTLHSGLISKAVEKLLCYGEMCIEAHEGLRLLNRYLHEVSLIESGVPYSSLGISERRKESARFFVFDPVRGEMLEDPALISNSSLLNDGSIAILKLDGVMTSQDDLSSYGVVMLESQLRRAYSNNRIEGVIIDTNSPGGEVTAMQMLVGAIEDRNKPVLGFARFAASAAYGTLAATDEIIASDKMARVGSIGAMLTIDRTFLEFYKENFLSFYGTDAPLKNKEWREALDGNFSAYQNLADDFTRKFHAQVQKQRSLTGGEAYQRATLSGDMFDAVEARRRGLVDGIGTLNYAISRAQSWTKMKKRKKAA